MATAPTIHTSEATGGLIQRPDLGDQAFAGIFEEYRAKLRRMVLLRLDVRLVGKLDLDDVLQDAFAEASRRYTAFLERPTVPLLVWLRQITSQVLIDAHRRYLGAQKRSVNREVSIDRWDGRSNHSAFLVEHLIDSLTSPSQFAVRNELLQGLRAALENLDETDREVLVLRHLEEMSNNETAEILGIDKSAASKRYVRALSRLRSAMAIT
ncbi:MAG: sigma-70 family RNA polymerase sigma factor [Planctomycetota bacterium]